MSSLPWKKKEIDFFKFVFLTNSNTRTYSWHYIISWLVDWHNVLQHCGLVSWKLEQYYNIVWHWCPQRLICSWYWCTMWTFISPNIQFVMKNLQHVLQKKDDSVNYFGTKFLSLFPTSFLICCHLCLKSLRIEILEMRSFRKKKRFKTIGHTLHYCFY